MAEIELSVLERQCLRRRIPDPVTLAAEVLAWQQKRNAETQSGTDNDPLAVHSGRCPDQAAAALPATRAQ